MPDQERNAPVSSIQRTTERPVKRMEITHDMVMAIADRVHAMLLQQMKIDAERNRFLPGPDRG
jgi:hypothetical protein